MKNNPRAFEELKLSTEDEAELTTKSQFTVQEEVYVVILLSDQQLQNLMDNAPIASNTLSELVELTTKPEPNLHLQRRTSYTFRTGVGGSIEKLEGENFMNLETTGLLSFHCRMVKTFPLKWQC